MQILKELQIIDNETYLDMLSFENNSMSALTDVAKNRVLSTVVHDNRMGTIITPV